MCSNCGWDEEVFEEDEIKRPMTTMEWIRSNPTIPQESPEVLATDVARAKFNLSPRRL